MVVTSRGHYQCRWEEAWGPPDTSQCAGRPPAGDDPAQRVGNVDVATCSLETSHRRAEAGGRGFKPNKLPRAPGAEDVWGAREGPPRQLCRPTPCPPREASPGTSRVVQTGWPGPRAWSSGPRRPRASRGPGVPRAPLRPSAPCSLSHLTLAVIPVREVLTPVDSGCLGRPQRGSSSPVVRHGVAGLGPVSAARPSGPAAPSDSQDS